jgi:hypothetical protein
MSSPTLRAAASVKISPSFLGAGSLKFIVLSRQIPASEL